jgi:putative membrane protein
MKGIKMIKRIVQVSVFLSLFIFIGLMWFIYLKTPSTTTAPFITYLPLTNAILNGLSAACVCAGIIAIIKKQKKCHIRLMISALIFSALFLVSYLIYHHFHGDTPFLALGAIRIIYFTILISHIILTIFALPLILITVSFALVSAFDRHKKIARWTVPIWLYVSITGILIYVLQVAFNS